MLTEDRGFSEESARKIEKVYLREKILKYDVVAGGFTLSHGAFMEQKVLRRAAEERKP